MNSRGGKIGHSQPRTINSLRGASSTRLTDSHAIRRGPPSTRDRRMPSSLTMTLVTLMNRNKVLIARMDSMAMRRSRVTASTIIPGMPIRTSTCSSPTPVVIRTSVPLRGATRGLKINSFMVGGARKVQSRRMAPSVKHCHHCTSGAAACVR
ncbi:hypothetical protein LP420_39565 [Massilia sp. B-10]|nr:hypothetical protein LP420_39565 [Massilia sp. B-10]